MNNGYEPVIGLEVHCELKTKSKMFCSCVNDPFGSEANANVCPICLGFPGTLPIPNKRAIEMTLMVGKALNCQPASESKFDRKNYFYPDLPKGYQISQYDLPLTTGGYMTVEGKRVGIRRVHLEEDTGKLLHQEGKDASLVDYNRAGVPLMELVTEPDITSPTEAVALAKELQQILRYVGVSNADMEKGEMRVEANISIRKRGSKEFGTKVEVKNLNSFRAVEQAIAYELSRQEEILDDGGKITQETRGWSEEKGETFSQRTKEEAEDYRYFPEPDIPPLGVSKWDVAMGELPSKAREKLKSLGVPEKQADLHVLKRQNEFMSGVIGISKVGGATVSTWVINEGIDPLWGVKPVAELITKVDRGEITAPMAKEAIKKAKETGRLDVPDSVQVISNQGELATIIDQILSKNSAAVADIKAGKKEALGFLVGQVMAETRGQADPKVVGELLKKRLE